MDKFRTTCRVIHLTSSGFLAGSIILNYFFNTHAMLADEEHYMSLFHPLIGVITLASGITNLCLLKPAKEEAQKGAKKEVEAELKA